MRILGTCAGATIAGLLLAALALNAAAQGVDWKTNHFVVTGSNPREIRDSIRKNRPFKEPFDAYTIWDIRWSFRFSNGASGCRCAGVSTVTSVNIYMPWWKVLTNAAPETTNWWRGYYTRLMDHEVGHARIGLTAAAHIRRQVASQPAAGDCESLKQQLNSAAEAVVADYRRQEKEYDAKTGHGSREP